MICNNCGNENAENVKFCSGCGAQLVADAEQPVQAVAQQQPVQEQAQYQQPNQAQ
ncbi:MAG: zinc-ribbon domain-containing protein, partial [Clostridiales bacterium]|nr:zinc-ribbon domain-containing protein [Clostridiales bacterium]